jgi:putative transposase
LSVLTGLKNRGLEDFLIAAVDGLKGFPEAIAAVYPKSLVQLCIVHMVRNSLRYVSWKHQKAVARTCAGSTQAADAEAAEQELEAFSETWDEVTPLIGRLWRTHWPNLIACLRLSARHSARHPHHQRRGVHGVHSGATGSAVKKRGAFPIEASLLKVLYLALMKAQERWTMPVREWPPALYHFSLASPGRVPL